MKKQNFLSSLWAATLAMVIAFASCADPKDDIKRLDSNLEGLKTELLNKVKDAQDKIQAELDKKVNTADWAADKKALEEKLGKALTKEEFEKAKAELNGKIDGKVDKTVYEDFLKKYADTLKDLEEKIKAADNTKAIEELEKKLNDKIAALEEQAKKLGIHFSIRDRRLHSLTRIPETYIHGIEALNFSPLNLCKVEQPNVIAKYYVSPSSITLDDIDVEKMKFVWNYATNLRAGDIAPDIEINKAEVKIEDGVLSVPLKIKNIDEFINNAPAANALNNRAAERFLQIALQAPYSQAVRAQYSLDGQNVSISERVVTSEFFRVAFTPIAANEVSLAHKINDSEFKEFSKTLAEAKALKVEKVEKDAGPTDPLVVVVEYKKSINLEDKVAALIGGNDVLTTLKNDYGLKLVFDLKESAATPDQDEKDIEYKSTDGKVNHQEFITIKDANKGTLEVKYDDISVQALENGRTPIVRVRLVGKDETCTAVTAYIKLYLHENSKPDPKKTPEVAKEMTVDCDNDFVLATEQDWTKTNIYEALKLSQADFHALYTAKPKLKGGKIGTLEEVVEADKPNTIKWTIANDKLWTLLGDEKYAEQDPIVIIDTVAYSIPSAQTPDVLIPVKATIKRPSQIEGMTVANGKVLSDYWFNVNDAVVVYNIAVPELGSEDDSKAIFENDLRKQFRTNENKELKLEGLDAPGEFEFVFHSVQPTVVSEPKEGLEGVVDPAGKKISMDGKDAIVIEGNTIKLKDDNDVLKEVLNANFDNLQVNIGIKVYPCGKGKSDRYYFLNILGKEYYTIKYRRPIDITENTTTGFKDAVNFGDKGSYIKVLDIVSLYDWRYSENGAEKDKYAFAPAENKWYLKYYGVESIDIDLDNAQVVYSDVTKPVKETPIILERVDKVEANGKEVATADDSSGFGYITYKNNNSNVKNFHIEVKAEVVYKWGKVISKVVKIPVGETVNVAPVQP